MNIKQLHEIVNGNSCKYFSFIMIPENFIQIPLL